MFFWTIALQVNLIRIIFAVLRYPRQLHGLSGYHYQDFFSQTLMIYRVAGEGRGPSLFLFTTFTHSRTFRQIFGTLLSHMRRQSHLNASHVFTKIYRNN